MLKAQVNLLDQLYPSEGNRKTATAAVLLRIATTSIPGVLNGFLFRILIHLKRDTICSMGKNFKMQYFARQRTFETNDSSRGFRSVRRDTSNKDGHREGISTMRHLPDATNGKIRYSRRLY